MEQKITREILTITSDNVTEADKALSAEFNKTAWRALAIANTYLKHGPETSRLAIVKSFITVLSKLSAVSAEAEMEEHRKVFLDELSELRAIDATSTSIPESAYDQDDSP